VPTSVLTVAVLFAEFGSATDELTDTESAITVPLVVPLFTFTTSVNVPAVNPAMLTSVQTTLPVPPVPGVMQLHPAGGVMETKVVFAGMGATSVALSAALGPLFVTTCV
jgi:hypothetical protein